MYVEPFYTRIWNRSIQVYGAFLYMYMEPFYTCKWNPSMHVYGTFYARIWNLSIQVYGTCFYNIDRLHIHVEPLYIIPHLSDF